MFVVLRTAALALSPAGLLVPATAALALSPAARARAPPLVVPASHFEHELGYRTATASTYAGVPLASHDAATRAKVLTTFARCHDAEQHPDAVFEDAAAQQRIDGRRRGQHMAEYDWQRDGQRVACKCTQLAYERGNGRWRLMFRDIKLATAGERGAAFDELLLCCYAPDGVHLFRHDLRAGVSTNGVRTASQGKQVVFNGPTNEPDWRVALYEILSKVEAKGCRPIVSARFDEPQLAAAIAETPLPFTASAFEDVPLADCSAAVRGGVLSRLVRRLDESWLHAGATFEDAVAGEDVNGRRRKNKAEYDWQRDGRRVACKSAGLGWDSNNERWRLLFSNVKLATAGEHAAPFDELMLCAYAPDGVHVFRHDLRAGVSTNGVRTASRGMQVVFVGPTNEPDWRVALGEILSKVEAKGCRPLAFVPWGEPAPRASKDT